MTTADDDIPVGMAERPLRGWKEIAAYLEVSEDAAHERTKWKPDPLPVYRDHRGPMAYRTALREWVMRTRTAFQHKSAAWYSTPKTAASSDDASTNVEKRRLK